MNASSLRAYQDFSESDFPSLTRPGPVQGTYLRSIVGTRSLQLSVDWLPDARKRLHNLSLLSQGWDGHTARPISITMLSFTAQIIDGLLVPELPKPCIVPLAYGGIQIEWHRKGWDLEVEIEAPNKLHAWALEHSTGQEQTLEIGTDLTALRLLVAVIMN